MTMIDIYYTYAQIDSESFTKFVLDRYYNIPNAQICKSIHGKPYIKGDKVFFNATHSKGLLALAVGKKRSRAGLRIAPRESATRRTQQIYRAGKERDFDHFGFLCPLDREGKLYQISRSDPRRHVEARGILRGQNLFYRAARAAENPEFFARKLYFLRLRQLLALQP